MAGFNKKFDEELGASLISEVQEAIGCFFCHAPDPKARCTQCKLAKYCDKKCQKRDWKEGDVAWREDADRHKDLCKIYLQNLAEGFPVALSLKGIGYIDEESLVLATQERLLLALEEIKRCFDASSSLRGERTPPIFLSLAVLPRQLGKLRLQGNISFYDHGSSRVQEVHMAVFFAVGEYDDAGPNEELLKQRGYLSYEARLRTLEALTNVVQHVRNAGLCLQGITLGRGLAWLGDSGFSSSEEGRTLRDANEGEALNLSGNGGARKYVPLDAHLELEQLHFAKQENDAMLGPQEYDSDNENVRLFELAKFPESDCPEGFESRTVWKERVNVLRAEFPDVMLTTVMGAVEMAGPDDVDCEEARAWLADIEAKSNETVQEVMGNKSEE